MFDELNDPSSSSGVASAPTAPANPLIPPSATPPQAPSAPPSPTSAPTAPANPLIPPSATQSQPPSAPPPTSAPNTPSLTPPSAAHSQESAQYGGYPAQPNPAQGGYGSNGYGQGYGQSSSGYGQGGYPQQGGYGQNQGGYGRGNYGQNQNFKRRFPSKEPEGPVELYLPYTIHLNPNFPAQKLDELCAIVKRFSEFGYTLRIGGGNEFEMALEPHAQRLELYLPWKGFNQRESKFSYNSESAKQLAALFHPGFEQLNYPIQAFIARNVRMMVGSNLKSPTLALIVYSEDGATKLQDIGQKTATARTVITLANYLRIPVFNLANENALASIVAYLTGG